MRSGPPGTGEDPAGRPPLSVVIAQRLRSDILSGELAQGCPLPSETSLAKRFEVGRSTVREALRILQAQGLVSGGIRVTTRAPVVDAEGTLPIAATALENVIRLERIALGDLVELRNLIEPAALAAAAKRQDAVALGAAEAALEQMERSRDDHVAFHQADMAFHAALIAAGGNRAFSIAMQALRNSTAGKLHDALEREEALPPVTDRLLNEHRAILDAVRSGDGEKAGRLVKAHIFEFYRSHFDGA